MLLSKAVVLLYKQTQKNGTFCEHLLVTAPHLKEQIPTISLQVVMTVLKMQNNHGNWEESCELTSYAILTLSSFAQLLLGGAGLHERVYDSINQGKVFLAAHRAQWKDGAYLWTEKVTYSSSILSEVYCLAATVNCATSPATIAIPSPFQVSERVLQDMSKARDLISRTPLFSQADAQLLFSAQVQACYILSDLQCRRLDIFPRTGMKEDKYLTFIPLTWTACMSLQDDCVSLAVLFDMMVLSMLNYQVDEYMEDMLEHEYQHKECFASARDTVKQLFIETAPSKNEQDETPRNRNIPPGTSKSNLPDRNDKDDTKVNGHENGNSLDLSHMKVVLSRYIAHILQHPLVVKSTRDIQTRLARELETFLLAHIDHAEDNYKFAHQSNKSSLSFPVPSNKTSHKAHNGNRDTTGDAERENITNGARGYLKQYENPGRTFYNWVHTTSADHTSCPFSFVFFQCLLSATHGDVAGRRPKIAYLVEDVCRHLASLCRMYNDYGSLARDLDESNLNSLNFPEFSGKDGGITEQEAKAQLMSIAEHERHCLSVALDQLDNELSSSSGRNNGKWMSAIRFFVNVTDLYGQIYVVKDIATRK